ncbi:MAG TPA: cytochrome c oxidase subunit 4 [Acidimicrobiales bacterium]|nr:cytochrome c oxidase subunit 4 [Acidimicrobiales bacterium]
MSSTSSSDQRVPWRIFLGIAVFMAVIGIVYWFASYEPAGATMLALASALAAVCGIYLRVQSEHGDTVADHADAAPYLPHASVWPFGVGLGAVLALNGLIVGLGFAVPGLVVLAVSVVGMVSQSRRRA